MNLSLARLSPGCLAQEPVQAARRPGPARAHFFSNPEGCHVPVPGCEFLMLRATGGGKLTGAAVGKGEVREHRGVIGLLPARSVLYHNDVCALI